MENVTEMSVACTNVCSENGVEKGEAGSLALAGEMEVVVMGNVCLAGA